MPVPPLARGGGTPRLAGEARRPRDGIGVATPKDRSISMNPNFRNFALWVIIFLLVLALVTLFQNPGHRAGGSDIAYSQLLNEADAGRIANVVISGPEISGTFTDGRTFTTYAPNDPSLV